MNWDWDKLQEKRQRQTGPRPAPKPAPPSGSNDFGEKLKNFKGFPFPAGKLFVVLAILIWAASGFFIVDPDEEGIILRFGKYDRSVEPGPHMRLPFPIESHLKPKVKQVQRIEIGFRSPPNVTAVQSQVRAMPEEAAMLTSDENIVVVQFIIQYRIRNAAEFLFKLARQGETVKSAAEAAMREIIGKSNIDAALTGGKETIQLETQKLLQDILNTYTAGIEVIAVQMQDVHAPQEVMSSFLDVASAREDRARATNEADAYRNRIIPEAHGIVAETVNQAEAYRETVVRRAQGESQRFLAILTEYNKAKDVTQKRLYLETMEEVLSATGIEKIVLPKDAASKALPLLPLDILPRGNK